MIAQWIARGAEIGITAPVALIVFGLCVLVIISIVGAIARTIDTRYEEDDKQ